MKNKPVCAVVGIGPGNGAALARRFAHEGYAIALARGTQLSEKLAIELSDARAYACELPCYPRPAPGDGAKRMKVVGRLSGAGRLRVGETWFEKIDYEITVFEIKRGGHGAIGELTADPYELSAAFASPGDAQLVLSDGALVSIFISRHEGSKAYIGCSGPVPGF